MQRLKKFCVLVIGIVLCMKLSAQTVDEYTLKAIWIGKFTHFIDWPSEIKSNSQNFTIAALTPNSFNGSLETIYKDYIIWDRSVQIIELSSIDELNNVHILYIPPLEDEAVLSIIKKTKSSPVLLIGDTKGYAELGVHINFFFDDSRIRFEINETAIRNSDFFISYRLLNIAQIVEPTAKN